MTTSRDGAGADDGLAALLASSGGKPVIQIVLEPLGDVASIRSAGIDGHAIPRVILNLGIALCGGIPPSAAVDRPGGRAASSNRGNSQESA
jgi:hypothetical protein